MTRSFTRSVVAATIAVAMFSACSGGSSSSPLDAGTQVAVGIDKMSDEFAFPNFGAKKSPEQFGTPDVVTMFGDGKEVCSSGAGDTCTLSAEAATWARMVNQARQSGHCEGFAVMAAARFMQKASPRTAELENAGDVTHGIMRGFATQFVHSVQDDANGWAKKSVAEKVAALDAALKSGKLDYVLGVYTKTGGHAVLPWKIEYVDDATARIHVYDSNWPGVDRYVLANVKDNSWSFSFSGKDPENDPRQWSGGARDMDMTSMGARSSGACPFCNDGSRVKTSLFVIRAAALDWSVATAGGKLSAVVPLAGESTARPLKAEDTSSPDDYLLNIREQGPVTFSLPSETHLTGITAGAAVEVQTSPDGSSTVEVSDNSVSSTDPGTVLTLAAGNLVATANGASTELTSTPEGITVRVETTDGTQVNVNVTEDVPAIEVRTEGNPLLGASGGYQVLTQTSANEITVKSVSASGVVSETTTTGTLASTSTEVSIPPSLATPPIDPSLPPPFDRDLIFGSAVAEPTTTTMPTTTTVPSTTTTVQRSTTTTSTTTPRPPSTTTTIAATTTTVPSTTTTVPAPATWSRILSAPTNEQYMQVVADGSGNTISTGYFCGRSITIGSSTLVNADTGGNEGDTCDTFVEKVDQYGSLVWATRIGGAGQDFARAVAVDVAGNVYFTLGFDASFSFAGSQMTVSAPSTETTMYGKLNSSGVPQWGRTPSTGTVTWSDVSAGSGVYLTVSVPGPAGSATVGGLTLQASTSSDEFIIQINPSNGNGNWSRKFTTSWSGDISDVVADGSGGAFVGGSFRGTATIASSASNVTLNNSSSTSTNQGFVARYDYAGTLTWAYSFGGTSDDTVSYLSTNATGHLYVGFDSTSSSVTYRTHTFNQAVLSAGQKNFGVIDLNTSGDVYWAKMTRVPTLFDVGGIAADQTGNVFVVARFSTSPVQLGSYGFSGTAGDADIIAFSINSPFGSNSNGAPFGFATQVGGTGDEYLQGGGGVAVDSNGYPVFAGDSWSPSVTLGPLTHTNNALDAFLVRITPGGVLQ